MAEIIKVNFNKITRQFHKDIMDRVDEMLANSAEHICSPNEDETMHYVMVEMFASLTAANVLSREVPRDFASWAELTKAGQRLGLEHSKRIEKGNRNK